MLKGYNIFTRRYFYPLISAFDPYCNLPSARDENLPHAVKAANDVLCLPIYADLENSDVQRICSIIKAEA
jgi:dTDP-4-amino-4,6-dideoxygalactose transaminase